MFFGQYSAPSKTEQRVVFSSILLILAFAGWKLVEVIVWLYNHVRVDVV